MVASNNARASEQQSGSDNVHTFRSADKREKRFSLVRVVIATVAVSIILVPGLFYVEAQGWLGGAGATGSGHGALAQVGSGRRSAPAFDLTQLTVPEREIHAGGPPKDGIPAISNPRFVSAAEATYLQPQDRVVGVVADQDVRAYPLKILNYHEIVNDRINNTPIAVTYCPLCDSADVIDRRTPLGEREFGVSGLLYNSNVLMYDRTRGTESLWSQVKAEGISGPGAEKPLKSLPLELTTWSDWLSRHPNTKVLSIETGHQRNYDRNPYGQYFSTPRLMFPAQPTSDRLPTKERVLGVWTENSSKAYPISSFSAERQQLEDSLDGKRVVIEYIPDANTLRVAQADEGVQWMYSLWFAWYAFHPETEVFE